MGSSYYSVENLNSQEITSHFVRQTPIKFLLRIQILYQVGTTITDVPWDLHIIQWKISNSQEITSHFVQQTPIKFLLRIQILYQVGSTITDVPLDLHIIQWKIYYYEFRLGSWLSSNSLPSKARSLFSTSYYFTSRDYHHLSFSMGSPSFHLATLFNKLRSNFLLSIYYYEIRLGSWLSSNSQLSKAQSF